MRVRDAYEGHNKNMNAFLKKYRPDEPGTWKHREWVEDVRKVSVGAQASFYTLVDRGELRLEGHPYLLSAVGTFDDFTIAEGPERSKAPSAMQNMEDLFSEPHDADVHIAGALRALAWQTEDVIEVLSLIQNRLQEANNL